MPIRKLCCHPGCTSFRLSNSKYCEKHREKDEAKDNERYINYLHDKYSSDESRLPSDKQSFYRTTKWKNMRREFLLNNPYCIYCGGLADQIHHDYPEKTDYFNDEMFFDTDRWQPICADCHRKMRNK